jgi:hypothetical protein
MAEVISPNFFIVGVPKSGTTSLVQYLVRHPDVFMCDPKEPNYFNSDSYTPHQTRDEAAYLALFALGRGRKRIGEASTHYLYSKVASERIRAFCPQALIVIMLRNPIEMIYSLHAHRVWGGREDIRDFEDALAAEDDRRLGRRLPQNPYPMEDLFYREMGKYSLHVRRYFETFGRRQVHVIVFDDFVRDTVTSYRGVCEFLDIVPQTPGAFEVHNPGKHVRSLAVRDFLRNSQGYARVLRSFIPVPLRGAIRRVVMAAGKANTRTGRRPTMRLELRRRLEAEFSSDVAALSELLQRDLTHWVRPQSGSVTLP